MNAILFDLTSGPKRKIDETITDFAVKQNDPPIVQQILHAPDENFNQYMHALTAEQWKVFYKYVMKQTQLQRVTDFIIANDPSLKSLTDYWLNNTFVIIVTSSVNFEIGVKVGVGQTVLRLAGILDFV